MRIRLTNPKTGETLTIPNVESDAVPIFAVQLGRYGILVNQIPDVPVCRCHYLPGGERIPALDCDEHTPRPPVRVIPINEPRPRQYNPFAEAVFQAAVQQMRELMRPERKEPNR